MTPVIGQKKILVFQHVAHEHPGLLLDAAKSWGVKLDILELWTSYKIPKMENYDGLIILGGPMGVYDDYPSKNDELAFIQEALGKIAIIGFCLGSQLLAHALGAKVYPNLRSGKKIKEIGYYDVTLTYEGVKDPMFKGFKTPIKVLEWHGDMFDLPIDAILLGTTPDCTNQAFKYGDKAYGMLFHNEFTPEMVENMIEIDKDWIRDGFYLDEKKLIEEAKLNKSLMKKQCDQLFKNFLKLIER